MHCTRYKLITQLLLYIPIQLLKHDILIQQYFCVVNTDIAQQTDGQEPYAKLAQLHWDKSNCIITICYMLLFVIHKPQHWPMEPKASNGICFMYCSTILP